MRSVRLQLLVLLVAAAAAYGAGPRNAGRRVVFLLDRSGSMPRHPSPQGFGGEVTSAGRAAKTILDEVERYGETSVGFYTFGAKDSLQPFGGDTVDMSPAEAKGRLNAFFSADTNYYNHRNTYIAYSIFQLVKEQLALGNDFGPDKDIPPDVAPLNVYVFTDGGEDYAPGFDNGPYERWLARQKDSLQLRWRTWKFFATGDELEDRNDGFKASPAEFVAYAVHFGIPPTAYSFSNVEPPANRTVNLEVSRLIRLIPAIPGDPIIGAEGCMAEMAPSATLTPSTAAGLRVQGQIHWPRATVATSEWAVAAPARPVVDMTVPNHAAPVHGYDRHILYLNLADSTPAVIDVSAGAGRYPVRLARESLCEQLKNQFPSSKFVFPASELPNELPAIGHIQVESVPVYTFAVAAQDAAKPNDRLAPLLSDRWHRYRESTRVLRVTPPPGITALIDATVLVRQGSKTSPELIDFVSLYGPSASGGAITIQSGENFTIQVPAKKQTWLQSVLEKGFKPPPGDYELVLRLRPRVIGAPAARYKTRVVCESCDLKRFLQQDDYVLLIIPVTVQKRPMSWICIALLFLAAAVFTWALIMWLTRPQFPEGFTIGTLEGEADLRSAHGDGLRGKLALFWRKPLYLDLRKQGRTMASRVPFLDTDDQAARNLLGLKPSRDRIHVWCVVKAAEDVRIELAGNRLEPRGSDVPSPQDTLQILHAELYVPSQLTVHAPDGENHYTVVTLQ